MYILFISFFVLSTNKISVQNVPNLTKKQCFELSKDIKQYVGISSIRAIACLKDN